MKRFFIMMAVFMLVAVVAMPMGLCDWGLNELPKAEVKVVGTLTIPPVIRLKVNHTEAIAQGKRDYDLKFASDMDLKGNYPTPGNLAYAESGKYVVKVYSNDEWAFFIWRSPIGRNSWAATEAPGFEWSKNDGGSYSDFPAGIRVDHRQNNSPTDNNYRHVGDFRFRAKYDAGSEPGTYGFLVGFVAYQE